MIWDIIQTSGFNDHFKSQSLTIQDLLADQNIITQMKNLNPQLLSYISTNTQIIFSKLIYYSTVIPDQNSDHNRGYLYPYVSSQILAIDSDIIYNAFFQKIQSQNNQQQYKSTKHWQNLINILNSSQQMNNSVILGYFAKIMNNLYKGRKHSYTKQILQSEVRNKLTKHLTFQDVGEIIKNLFVLLDTPEQVLIQARKKYLNEIIDVLVQPNLIGDPQLQQKTRKVISIQILTPIITKFQTYSSGQQLIKLIFQSSSFEKLYNIHYSLGLIQLFTNILNKSKQTISTADDYKKQYMLVLPQKHKQKLVSFAQNHLQALIDKYDKQNIVPVFQNQNKIKVKPTNPQILLYCSFLSQLTANSLYLRQQISVKTIDFLFIVISHHPYNDILQSKIIQICIFLSKIKEKQNNCIQSVTLILNFLNLCKSKALNYRPHLYVIWKAIKSNQSALKMISSILDSGKIQNLTNQNWQKISIEYFSHLQKAQTVKWGTNIKAEFSGKIIVDQEDKKQNKGLDTQVIHEIQKNNQHTQPIIQKKQQKQQKIFQMRKKKQQNNIKKTQNKQIKKQDVQIKNSKQQIIPKKKLQKSQVKNEIKKQKSKESPSFDFFNSFGNPNPANQNNKVKQTKKNEPKKQEEKNSDKKNESSKKMTFDDFANFGF